MKKSGQGTLQEGQVREPCGCGNLVGRSGEGNLWEGQHVKQAEL